MSFTSLKVFGERNTGTNFIQSFLRLNTSLKVLKGGDGGRDDIKKHIETTLLKNLPLSVIHGDLCFSNILYSDQGKIVRLIDPRGAFGEVGIFGDPLYDVAKLRHSYQGAYEYIINDAFTVTHKDKEIIFSLSNNNLVDIQLEFERFPRFTSLESKLIEGLIFIGMCSRHYDGPQRQIVMYATGLNILNKIIS